ncbi:MAG: adenosylcobalamin-dependent ribonucleoside-diphosphate reductase, partial [Elusimicrobia bacterium]|nr:adenosylcobalamin-dependent ribonucleoside-diphosphate reductase [Elusimicrobiota bacterium]
YLRGETGVGAWLEGVAGNLALAEVLLAPEAPSWGVFDGVSVKLEQAEGPKGFPPPRALLFQSGAADAETRELNFQTLLGNLKRAVKRFKPARRLHERYRGVFLELMAGWRFLPNSPTLMNAGRPLQQLSACYVLPVPDSMEGITAALSAQALIQKSGGGTGFSFSRLRPRGEEVRKTRGVASGALSFMRLFDTMTDVVKQGGARRGANMGVLHYTHPEILDFIALKGRPGALENFNLSVGIDARFMQAVETGADYGLVNPRTGQAAGKASARLVFERMAQSAWRTGDPGLVVLDRINASNSNPVPDLGDIEATNPSGEQPLLPWEPCNLGSLNLSAFVQEETAAGRFDFAALRRAVAQATRLLDDVIEVNNYPLPQIEAWAKRNRRIGLGVMGYAEALVKLGLPYDSPKALDFAERLMGELDAAALDASEALARERGPFPNWKGSIYDPGGPCFRGVASAPRHCARTTIAPTGTIALAAGLQGSGIEPFFGIAYSRRNAKALDAAKRGRAPDAADVYVEANPLFRALARKRGCFGLAEKALWDKIAANGGRVRGLARIPPEVQALFPTAHDVSAEMHIKTAAAFQRHTDNGVSKTINLPAAATVDAVAGAFRLAYSLGLKGITVYRDRSKAEQVLSLSASPAGGAPAESCPRCGSSNVSPESGCGPACHDCGYAECS